MRMKEIEWWYWLATVALLGVGLGGWNTAFYLAMLLTAVQLAHFAWRERSAGTLPVQVRAAYLGMLVAAQWQPLHALYWIQLVGTSALVLFDYCPLARVLSLFPWNRRRPLTFGLLRTTFTAPPRRRAVVAGGGIAGSGACACRRQIAP